MPETSFIPKKAPSFLTQTRPPQERSAFGGFVIIPSVILLLSFAATGTIFFYKSYLFKQTEELSLTVKRVEGQFEAPLIGELNRVSRDVEAAKEILSKHNAQSRIFAFLEENTHRAVRFSSFAMDKDSVFMDGVATSYTTLAEQMRMFEQSGVVRDLSISNLGLQEGGRVGFKIRLSLDPKVTRYEQ